MSTPLRVLIVEDHEDDIALMVQELCRGGFAPAFERVETPSSMAASLKKESWDLVLSNYSMPRFSGPEVLRLLRGISPDIPLIIISGAVGEETAVEAVVGGADDYVMKSNLTRLVPAVRRALLHAQERRKRRELEEKLRQSQILIDHTRDAVFWMNKDARFFYLNEAASQSLGYLREELLTMSVHDIDPDFPPEAWPDHWKELKERGSFTFESRHRAKDGRIFPVEITANHICDGDRETNCVFVRDISDRKEVERRQDLAVRILDILNRSNGKMGIVGELLEVIKDHTGCEAVGIRLREGEDFPYYEVRGFSCAFVEAERFLCSYDSNGQVVRDGAGNPVLECMCGNVIRGRVDPSLPFFTSGGSFWTNSTTALLASTSEEDRQSRTRNRCNGEGYESVALIPLRSDQEDIGLLQLNDHRKDMFSEDVITFFEGIGQSIGVALAQKEAEAAILEGEKRYRSIFETAPSMITSVNGDGVIEECNDRVREYLGYEKGDIIGQGMDTIIHPEDLPMAFESLNEIMRFGSSRNKQYRMVQKDGESIFVNIDSSALMGPDGAFERTICIIEDVTESKRVEEERAGLEAQLHHAQKMEAVGRLAGGVAHDFNNIITVVNGHAEMMLSSLDPADPMFVDVKEIKTAAERAAALTQQLLTFSRKQITAPKIVNLNDIVDVAQKMLCRIIGENIDFSFTPYKDLWLTEVDSGQVDQILVNLVVNARDAMPDVGTLSVETGNVFLDEAYCRIHSGFSPGEYVKLIVGDTGCGMDEETLNRIFEPFFTTKEVGKGTGLGLSTVYGIVKQNKGFINVHSEAGVGTTIECYFPRVEGPTAPDQEIVESDVLPTGTEFILLVEDQVSVRKLAKRVLEKEGYRVVEAEDGMDAYGKSRLIDETIDLLVTDVVMPNMNGIDLFRKMKKDRPELKVMYISGYTEDFMAIREMLPEKPPFLHKPFRVHSLTKMVRDVLDG